MNNIKRIRGFKIILIYLFNIFGIKKQKYICYAGKVFKIEKLKNEKKEIINNLKYIKKIINNSNYTVFIDDYHFGENFYLLNGFSALNNNILKNIVFISSNYYTKQLFTLYGFNNFYFLPVIPKKLEKYNTINIKDCTGDDNYFQYNSHLIDDVNIFFKNKYNIQSIKLCSPNISDFTKNYIDTYLQNIGVYHTRFVFLSLDSQTFDSKSIYGNNLNYLIEYFVELLTKKGYNVLINSDTSKTNLKYGYKKNYSYLNGKINNQIVQTVFFDIEKTYYLYSQAELSIQTRSGLNDILAVCDSTKLIVLYHNINTEFINRFKYNKIYPDRDNIIELKGYNIEYMRDIETNELFNWEENL